MVCLQDRNLRKLFFNDYIIIDKPEITYQEHDIDILIKERNKYAIIIENKIWDARDQNNQIQKYVKYVQKDLNVPKNMTYVVYLTKDGNKQVKSNSLTDEARKMLGMTLSHNGRFVELNFREHILSWLENTILPMCDQNDYLFLAALHQYIDYLKGFFNLRYDDKMIQQNKEQFLKERLNMDDLKDAFTQLDKVNNLQETLNNLVEEQIYMIGSLVIDKLKNKGYDAVGITFSRKSFEIQITPDNWKKSIWVLKSEGKDQRLFSGVYDEGELSQKSRKVISSYYDEKQNSKWAGLRYEDKFYVDDNFWLYIREHQQKFTNDIIRMVDDIISETENLVM